jgi:hypothetical protein
VSGPAAAGPTAAGIGIGAGLDRVPAGLTARRSWPHAQGLAVEAVGPGDRLVGLVVTAGGVRVLDDADPDLPALAPALREPGSVLLGHRPGRRAVLRDRDGHYVKIVRPGRARRVAAGLDGARHRLDAVPGAPVVPAVLDLDAAAGRVRIAAVPGPSLHELLAVAPDAAVTLCGATRAALGALRRADASGLRRHSVEDELAVLERWTAAADAHTGGDLASATGPVAAALRALPTRSRVPCHRDLHDKQVIATAGDGPGVGLIDLDTLAAAHPALDPGNLLAHLHLRTLQGHCDAAVAQRCASRLLDPDVDPAALRAFTAAALLRLAAVYSVRPGLPDLPRRLAGLVPDPVPSSWLAS